MVGVIVAGSHGHERVAGRSLVERTRELLARAGCEEIVEAPEGAPSPALPHFVGEGEGRGEGRVIVVSGDVVFDRDVLPALVARGEGVVRCERGFVLLAPSSAAEPSESGGVIFPAATAEERAAASRALLRGTKKPNDGPMRRLFERRVGLLIAERLVERSVTPNAVTATSLAVGLLGAGALGLPGYVPHVLGALLVVLAKVGDTCDGSLARAKLLESKSGDLLDTVADVVLALATFTAVGVSAVRESPGALGWAVLLVVGAALACFAHELFRRREAVGALAWLREVMDRAAMLEWGYPLLAFALVDALGLFVAAGAVAAAGFAFVYFAVGLRASLG